MRKIGQHSLVRVCLISYTFNSLSQKNTLGVFSGPQLYFNMDLKRINFLAVQEVRPNCVLWFEKSIKGKKSKPLLNFNIKKYLFCQKLTNLCECFGPDVSLDTKMCQIYIIQPQNLLHSVSYICNMIAPIFNDF